MCGQELELELYFLDLGLVLALIQLNALIKY